jgi:hypothetical protein
MDKALFYKLGASFILVTLLSSCAARQKTQIVQISTSDSKSTNIMKSVKCAIQQAGWNITYSDNDSVSATKAAGMDNVPITLNIRLQERQNNSTKAIFTVGSPRGVYGNGDYYSKDVVNALQNCGARGLVVEEPNKEDNIDESKSVDPLKTIQTTPVEQPAEQPAERPVAKPLERPVETKSDSSVAPQSTVSSSASMVVIGNKAKIRKKPSTKADIVRTVKKGEVVQVIKQSDEWFQIELVSGDVGWCHKSVLERRD